MGKIAIMLLAKEWVDPQRWVICKRSELKAHLCICPIKGPHLGALAFCSQAQCPLVFQLEYYESVQGAPAPYAGHKQKEVCAHTYPQHMLCKCQYRRNQRPRGPSYSIEHQ